MLDGSDPRDRREPGIKNKMVSALLQAGLVILALAVMVWIAWAIAEELWGEPYCDKYLPDVDAYEACLADEAQFNLPP